MGLQDYIDEINELKNQRKDLNLILTKRSAQIGDLKNKLIKAQAEIITLSKEIEKLYQLKDLKNYAT